MHLTLFWILAGAITAGVAVILVLALLRGGRAAGPAAAYDLQVYRDQLREIERDEARGTLGAEEAGRLRAEVSRRLLEADRALRTGETGAIAPRGTTLAAAGGVVLVVGGALAAYLDLGQPGYGDLPMTARLALADAAYRARPSQAEAEAARAADAPQEPAAKVDPAFLELMDKLRAAVEKTPDDLRGQELLARNEAGLGNFVAAAKAQAQVVTLKAATASAEDHAALAELRIMAAGGLVSPEAEASLTEALRIDPENGTARYYSGLLLAQTGRPDLAFRLWRGLLEGSQPGDPWVPALRAQIEQLAWLAGVNYRLPEETAAPGPDAAQVQAAQAMSPEERQTMIRTMVEGLNQRLATEGGTAEEWARLIGALGVLGETERAKAIFGEAETRFAGRDEDLGLIRAAAAKAGVAQ